MTGRVLFVCTGNQCRSPMAEALLRHQLPADSGIEVASAGTVGDGTPPPPHAVETMAEIGLDIAGRPSRPLTAAEVERSDLIIGMARDHLVAAAALSPAALPRAFTLTDLLRRAGTATPRMRGETVGDWATRLGAGRLRQTILALPASGDIPDPMGRSYVAFQWCRDQLRALTGELASFLTGIEAVTGRPPQEPARESERKTWRRARWS